MTTVEISQYDKELLDICKGDENKARMLKCSLEKTSPYSTAIIDPGKYPLKDYSLGSGTYAIMNGERGILTNHHVIEDWVLKKLKSFEVPFTDKNGQKLFIKRIEYLDNPQNKIYYPDLAFIVLEDASCKLMTSTLKKTFFDLDAAKDLHHSTKKDEKVLCWIIHLIHGNVGEGARPINNRQTIHFKNATSYLVVPDLENKIEEVYSYASCDVSFDLVNCPIGVSDRSALPRSFRGMSGAALWQIIFNSDNMFIKLDLIGVAALQDSNPLTEKNICLGPQSIYSVFYETPRKVYYPE